MNLKTVINLVIILFFTMNTVSALENAISTDVEQKEIYLREELQYKEDELKSLEGILDHYYNFREVDLNIETLDINLNSSKNLFRTNLWLENRNSITAEIKIRLKFDNRYSFAPESLIKPNKIDFSNLDTRETQDIASLGLDINNKDHFISNNKDYITIILEPREKIDGKFLLGIGRAFREQVNFNILFNIEANPIIDIAEIKKEVEELNKDINDIKIQISSLEELGETIEQEEFENTEEQVKEKVANEIEAIENKTEIIGVKEGLGNNTVEDDNTITEGTADAEEQYIEVKEVAEEIEETTVTEDKDQEVNKAVIEYKVDKEDQKNETVEKTDVDSYISDQEIEEAQDDIVEEEHLEEYNDQETIDLEENTLEIENEINQEDFSIINKNNVIEDQQDKKENDSIEYQ
ncbi:hypothetical protein [Brassicibacter mesophilus]|uniref:hypothetical protein n=1 Tax=Brassicibacter mesophilus TaxID=745119 RepID=UPI003D1F36F9